MFRLASHHLLAEHSIPMQAPTHVRTLRRLSHPRHTQVRPMTHYWTLGMTSSGLLPADLAALLSNQKLPCLWASRVLTKVSLTQTIRRWKVRPLVSLHTSCLSRLLKNLHRC